MRAQVARRVGRYLVIPAALALITPCALAQWLEFVDETANRLVASAALGVDDLEEKDYAWGDVDRDGDIDLVIVRKEPFTSAGKRRNVLLLNENGVLMDRTDEFASESDVPGDLGFRTPTNDRDVQLVDLDLDGWLDMVTAVTISDGDPKHLGHPRIYMNKRDDPGTGNWLGFRHEDARIPTMLSHTGQAGFNPRFCSVAVGDVTGDGYPDLWFGDYDSSGAGGNAQPPGADYNDRLLVNQGASKPGFFDDLTSSRFIGGNVPGQGQPFEVSAFGAAEAIGDINGDGVDDIVKQTSLNSPRYVGIAYNDVFAEGFFDTYQVVDEEQPYFIAVGDLNNDDRLDVIVQDDNEDHYYINLGNGGDGLADFTVKDFSWDVAGDEGFGSNTIITDLNNDSWNDVIIADVDVDIPGCDRRTQIYHNLGGQPGDIVTLLEETTGTGCAGFPSPASCIVASIPGNKLRGTHDVAVFDLDGDGWKDLVIGRCSGTEVYLNQPPPPAGGVPDGDGVPGTQLTVDKAPQDRVALAWGDSCQIGDTDYEIYEGTLGDFASHVPVTCTTGGATQRAFSPGPASTYYLVVPSNDEAEGSYGVDSGGAARTQGVTACRPQSVELCEELESRQTRSGSFRNSDQVRNRSVRSPGSDLGD